MDSKKEYIKLVGTVKNLAKARGERLTNEEIANRLGYNRSYFSTLMGSAGKVEKSHIEDFKLRFQNELAGVIKPVEGDSVNRERALIKVLMHRVAKLEAERLGIPVELVLAELEKDTMIAWRDLEQGSAKQ